jgi:hypothetical protein
MACFDRHMPHIAQSNYEMFIDLIAGGDLEESLSEELAQMKSLSDKIIRYAQENAHFKEYMKKIVNQITPYEYKRDNFLTISMPSGQLQYLKDISSRGVNAFGTPIQWPDNLRQFIAAMET